VALALLTACGGPAVGTGVETDEGGTVTLYDAGTPDAGRTPYDAGVDAGPPDAGWVRWTTDFPTDGGPTVEVLGIAPGQLEVELLDGFFCQGFTLASSNGVDFTMYPPGYQRTCTSSQCSAGTVTVTNASIVLLGGALTGTVNGYTVCTEPGYPWSIDFGTPVTPPPDAGVSDAGPSDAGSPDAGPPVDAGVPPDAGPPPIPGPWTIVVPLLSQNDGLSAGATVTVYGPGDPPEDAYISIALPIALWNCGAIQFEFTDVTGNHSDDYELVLSYASCGPGTCQLPQTTKILMTFANGSPSSMVGELDCISGWSATFTWP
jgi:hypothetical protein